jgi:hypothetical protein
MMYEERKHMIDSEGGQPQGLIRRLDTIPSSPQEQNEKMLHRMQEEIPGALFSLAIEKGADRLIKPNEEFLKNNGLNEQAADAMKFSMEEAIKPDANPGMVHKGLVGNIECLEKLVSDDSDPTRQKEATEMLEYIKENVIVKLPSGETCTYVEYEKRLNDQSLPEEEREKIKQGARLTLPERPAKQVSQEQGIDQILSGQYARLKKELADKQAKGEKSAQLASLVAQLDLALSSNDELAVLLKAEALAKLKSLGVFVPEDLLQELSSGVGAAREGLVAFLVKECGIEQADIESLKGGTLEQIISLGKSGKLSENKLSLLVDKFFVNSDRKSVYKSLSEVANIPESIRKELMQKAGKSMKYFAIIVFLAILLGNFSLSQIAKEE